MLDKFKPLILLDAGYSFVYRYFAIQFYYRKAYPRENPKQEWSRNAKFMDKYRTRYLDSITKILKKLKAPISNVVLAHDDSRRNLFRTKKIPSYKADRIHDVELNKVLAIAFESILPKIIRETSIKPIGVKGLEADDIIACIAKYAVNNGWQQVFVLSADKDLTHLQEYSDKIRQFTLTIKEVLPKMSLLEHIVLGDASDNIPSCLKFGQGKKYLQTLLENDAQGLKDLVETDKDFAKCFKNNMLLIDFDNIPKRLQQEVIKKFKQQIG